MDKFLFYDVTPGEDMETIASKLYGDKEKWKAIYEMNKEKLPSSPRKSLAKMKIIIPVYDN
jgi:nucleoid-associated protein YgaU